MSSGGARGLAHVGVIEELENRGYEIAEIAGCSAGALVGGMYAAGKMPEFKDWICNLDRLDVFSLMDFTFSSRGFIKGEKVYNALKKSGQRLSDRRFTNPIFLQCGGLSNWAGSGFPGRESVCGHSCFRQHSFCFSACPTSPP
ncbi:patatin-like phospholipase family protein [Algoriphagus boritolerans]|uniref:patatin-like phospholipase family protein n=1 Tax=Algoriphagus boritolerans TaxID=308111 RepID=UPI002FCE65A0